MHLTLHLTHACNLRCTYCYTGEKLPSRHMRPEVARQAIDWAHGAAPPDDHISVLFFGGEPLIRRDVLEDAVAHCERVRRETGRTFYYKVITNGLLVVESFLEFANRHGFVISVSCDGVREAHDAGRRGLSGRGSFDELLPRLRLIRRESPFALVTPVVTPANVRWLAESVEWLFDEGFRHVHLQVEHEADWDRRSFRTLRDQYRRLANLYIAKMRRGDKFHLNCFDEKIHAYIRSGGNPLHRCGVGGNQASVAPSGRLYPCVSFVGTDDEERFQIGDIWNGVDESKLGDLSACARRPKPTCEGCALVERCGQFCACLNHRTTGHVDQVAPIVCEHERMLTPIADWVGNELWRSRNRLFIHKFYNSAYPLLSHVEESLEHWAEQQGIDLAVVDDVLAAAPSEMAN